MHRQRVALIALVGAGALAGWGVAAARHSASPGIRLLFAGDILLSRQVGVERRRTGQSPWDSVETLFAHADWVAGNLEGAIGSDSACVVPSAELCFAFDDESPRLVAAAGFTALTNENNHAADLGPRGRASTINSLARAGVPAVDFARSPRFMRVDDLTVGLIAISMIRAADGREQHIPSVDVAQRLRLARALANVVIVSIHWGNELQDWPSSSERAAAAWLVDHGADVVMGHHPHVVQRPDCVHGHPVFYSLGNHVFDQKYPATKEGLIADCLVRDRRIRCGGIRTHARRGSAVPVPSGVFHDAALDGCSVVLTPSLEVSGWTLRPAPWSRANADSDGVVIEGWRDGEIRWRTRRVELVALASRLAVDSGPQLLLALERHLSTMDGEAGLRPHVYEVGSRGLVARWRGTALAWPLLDATVDGDGDLCALHRGDSFLRLDPTTSARRTMRYRWNGFGFTATTDVHGRCATTFADEPVH